MARLEGLDELKTTITSWGTEVAMFQLNHLLYRMPPFIL
jgi:hypothetical protein